MGLVQVQRKDGPDNTGAMISPGGSRRSCDQLLRASLFGLAALEVSRSKSGDQR